MKLIFKTLSTLSPREIIRLCNAFNGMFDTNLMSTGEIDMLICLFVFFFTVVAMKSIRHLI